MIRDGYALATGGEVEFGAREVRRERTGVHALVVIALDKEVLAYSAMNVERDEDRTRLVNAAYKRMGAANQKAAAALKPAFDAFCYDLWERWLAGQGAVSELEPVDSRPEYLVPPYIVRGGGTILYGPGGSGKTYLAMLMMRAMEGLCDIWPASATARAVFVQLERSRETFARRVHLVNRALGIDPETPMRTLLGRGRTLADVADVLRREVQRDGISVVVLDSISRAGAGALVKDETANQIMDTLNGICPTWLAVAHTSHEGKADEGRAHIFGSAHFEYAADICVQVSAEPRDWGLGCALQVTKANDMAKPPAAYLGLLFDERGLWGTRQAYRREFERLPEVERRPLAERILEVLVRDGETSAAELMTMFSAPYGTVTRTLSQDGRFVRTRKDGRTQFWGAAVRT